MPKFKLTLKGNKAVLKGLEKVKKEARKKIGQEIESTAWDIQSSAISRAPVNDGILKNSITVQAKDLEARVEVGVNYAPFIEFGTGSKVQIPAGFQDYASTFQGRTDGTWQEFEENMKQWLKKKGIEEEALYPIMASIYRNGITARPFLFPAFEQATKYLSMNIEEILKDSTK